MNLTRSPRLGHHRCSHRRLFGRVVGLISLLSFSLPIHAAEEALGEKPLSQRPAPELVTVETRLLPYTKLSDAANPDEGRLKIRPESWRVRVGYPPHRFAKSGALLGGNFTYENLRFSYRNETAEIGDRVDTVHGLQWNGFFRHPLGGEKWALQSFFTAGIHSDFENVTSRSLRFQGGALWQRTVAYGSYSIGVVALDDFGRTRVFPGVGAEWNIDKRQKITIRAPVETAYTYTTETWTAGVAAGASGGGFRIGEKGPYQNSNLNYSIVTIGPTLEWRLSRRLKLEAEAGTTLYHTLEFRDGRHQVADFDLRRGPYGRFGITVSL